MPATIKLPHPTFETALAFIHRIGINTSVESLPAGWCFLPGLLIRRGRIVVDPEGLIYPGDILHEAAHLAVVPSADRPTLDGSALASRPDAPAEEMMAIAWSYAACIHLNIDPAFVFHEQGYRGGGQSIIDNFKEGRYIGVPLLQWLGMTGTAPASQLVYPSMIKWLRD